MEVSENENRDYFNPRSPRGERHERDARGGTRYIISIHAPREGSDRGWSKNMVNWTNFNPRSPRGERRELRYCGHYLYTISIHAPREGSDIARAALHAAAYNFNPRSPRGERLIIMFRPLFSVLFQSTLPARGATNAQGVTTRADLFQSTLPARGATCVCCWSVLYCAISIHAPREGSDRG